MSDLNGLNVPVLEGFLGDLKQPENLDGLSGPWRARVSWQGGFKAKAHMRTHMLELDEPAVLGTGDVAASAHELLLSAVASCMMVGFVLNATRRGVRVDDLEIAIDGTFAHIARWAGLDDSGNPGYGAIKAKAFVRADADEATIAEIWKLAVDGSPVTQTVTHATPVTTELEIL
jgi:uncharacterized OsmC-like protein